MTWSRIPVAVRYALLVLAIVIVWQAYVSLWHVNKLLVSSPLDVGAALAEDLRSGKLFAVTFATLQNLLVGMLAGALVGFALASFAVFSKVGHDLLTVLSAIFNPLPSIAILPLAMIWFGLRPESIIFVVALASVWPVAINTDTGFRTISLTTQLAARNLGLRGWRLVLDVLLPAALPSILSGLKSSWAFGWRTVVAAELVFGVAGSAGGLGWYINNARYFLNTSTIFAGLVVISVLGILVEAIFGIVERNTVVKWGMKRAG
ncbi:MAG: sulfonate transport system permease protein [Candidatus Eremiobacteraeota bacterium]|jgi:NitT/TauT family transport system permease protein|nr:sulfonate transport system permease protein [Candidatus Eremiobacteraeota bacterium]